MTREHRKSKESRAKKKKKKKGKTKARRSKRIKNVPKHFKIFYQNIRGIISKVDSLTETVDDTNPTIICLVETHMLKEVRKQFQDTKQFSERVEQIIVLE